MRSAVDAVAGSETDTDLETALVAARGGAEWGFVALYRDVQPRLLRYATALAGAEAEDVTAETWLHIARDLHRFDGDLDGFRGWASTICRNRATDAARRRGRGGRRSSGASARRRGGPPSRPPPPTPPTAEALTGLSSRAAIALIGRRSRPAGGRGGAASATSRAVRRASASSSPPARGAPAGMRAGGGSAASAGRIQPGVIGW